MEIESSNIGIFVRRLRHKVLLYYVVLYFVTFKKRLNTGKYLRGWHTMKDPITDYIFGLCLMVGINCKIAAHKYKLADHRHQKQSYWNQVRESSVVGEPQTISMNDTGLKNY